jgi:hypothetical protein
MKLESRREMSNSVDDGDEDVKLQAGIPIPVVTEKEQEYLDKLKASDETHGGI